MLLQCCCAFFFLHATACVASERKAKKQSVRGSRWPQTRLLATRALIRHSRLHSPGLVVVCHDTHPAPQVVDESTMVVVEQASLSPLLQFGGVYLSGHAVCCCGWRSANASKPPTLASSSSFVLQWRKPGGHTQRQRLTCTDWGRWGRRGKWMAGRRSLLLHRSRRRLLERKEEAMRFAWPACVPIDHHTSLCLY
jgi:hypothetical protein